MKFSRETPGAVMVRSVSESQILIGADTFDRTVALTSDKVLSDWPGKSVSDLNTDDFSELLSGSPEVIIVGTGKTNLFPPRDLVFAMARLGVGFEVMDTYAAARTFNVLASEDRRVAAVLYL